MTVVYPTFILKEDDYYAVSIPDLEIHTEGDSFADAIYMARDAICMKCITLEDKGKELPKASDRDGAIAKKELDFAGATLTFVDADLTEYRRKEEKRTIRRNVSIPCWLDYEAKKAKLNVSRVLQEALKEALGFWLSIKKENIIKKKRFNTIKQNEKNIY